LLERGAKTASGGGKEFWHAPGTLPAKVWVPRGRAHAENPGSRNVPQWNPAQVPSHGGGERPILVGSLGKNESRRAPVEGPTNPLGCKEKTLPRNSPRSGVRGANSFVRERDLKTGSRAPPLPASSLLFCPEDGVRVYDVFPAPAPSCQVVTPPRVARIARQCIWR